MATRVTINLPSINGEIEAGITIGVDASLPADKRLSILVQANRAATIEAIKQNALTWAYDKFNDPTARKLFLNGIAGIIDLGLSVPQQILKCVMEIGTDHNRQLNQLLR